MSSCVLDASSVLALIGKEPGWERVVPHLTRAVICSVNLSEVAAKLAERGAEIDMIERHLSGYEMEVLPFDTELAYMAAGLRPLTRSHGLSFGDRACLAAGLRRQLPIVTAEREWQKLEIGVSIEIIR